MAIDIDQLPSREKHAIIVMSRASIVHVIALVIDLDLESMNDHPLSAFMWLGRYW
jgi:hypothetical protein